MPLFYSSHELIYFVHCPKAGGSSVEDYILGAKIDLTLLDRKWLEKWRSCHGVCGQKSSPQHLTWQDAIPLLERYPDSIFSVVRNPISRIQSEFRHQKTRRSYWWLERWLGWMSFSTWLRAMCFSAKIEPYVCDNHIRCQSDLMPASGVIIFKLEDGFDDVVNYLAKKEITSEDDFPESMKSKGDVSIRLTKQDLKFILKFYRNDFERFGYTNPTSEQIDEAPTDQLAWLRTLIGFLVSPIIVFQYSRGRL